jgi:hypothetical protein
MWYYTWLRWLNQDSGSNGRDRARGTTRRPSLVPSLLLLEDRTLPSTLTVLNNADSGDGSLRAVIAAAQDGDQIAFDPSLQGETIALTSGELVIAKSLDIDGLGAGRLAVSGNHASRVFDISGGATVTIAGLTITDGLAPPTYTGSLGGGIFNSGDHLTLDNVVLQNNVAGGSDLNDLDARGGGLYSTEGSVTIANSTIAGNQAIGGNGYGGSTSAAGDPGGSAQGGGIYASGGMLTVSSATISTNSATGGDGGSGGSGYYQAGYGGPGGSAQGGGVYASGTTTVMNSTVAANSLRGGQGGGTNQFAGGGSGGAAQGSGIYASGTVMVNNSTVAANILRGGDGGGATFGYGGNGGAGQGGGIYASGTVMVNNSTVAANVLRGADGGGGVFGYAGHGGNGGAGQGGGLWMATGTAAQVSFSTLAVNLVTGGSHGSGLFDGSDGPATGGGVSNQGMLQTHDTLLAGNVVDGPGSNSGPDLGGDLGSLGHNLVATSQGGSGFDATDLLDIDPLLGQLQCNGGPTQTIALLPGSPALNAGDPDQLGVPDQRGVVRTGGVNIGAYQASATAFGVDAPATVTAGVPFDVTVTAVDPFGQVAVGYSGTVTFSTTDPDPGVVLPADYIFTADDGGMHSFTDTGLGETTLLTPGDQMLTVTDTVDATISGIAIVTVDPDGSGAAFGGSSRPFGPSMIQTTTPVRNVTPNSTNATLEGFFVALAEEETTFPWLRWEHKEPGEQAGWVLELWRQKECVFV